MLLTQRGCLGDEPGLRPCSFSPVERGVIQNHHGVGVEREPLEGEDAVVGLDDDVGLGLVPVWEDGVGLDQLLGEVVVELLEHEGPEA
jgi:hypothetical protein